MGKGGWKHVSSPGWGEQVGRTSHCNIWFILSFQQDIYNQMEMQTYKLTVVEYTPSVISRLIFTGMPWGGCTNVLWSSTEIAVVALCYFIKNEFSQYVHIFYFWTCNLQYLKTWMVPFIFLATCRWILYFAKYFFLQQSADWRDTDQYAKHQPNSFQSRNIYLKIIQKLNKLFNCDCK